MLSRSSECCFSPISDAAVGSLDFQLVLVLTRVRKARTGEVGLQVQPEPSVRFCPQDGKEDRSPKKSVKIQEQGLPRHSIHNFTLVNSIAETHFA